MYHCWPKMWDTILEESIDLPAIFASVDMTKSLLRQSEIVNSSQNWEQNLCTIILQVGIFSRTTSKNSILLHRKESGPHFYLPHDTWCWESSKSDSLQSRILAASGTNCFSLSLDTERRLACIMLDTLNGIKVSWTHIEFIVFSGGKACPRIARRYSCSLCHKLNPCGNDHIPWQQMISQHCQMECALLSGGDPGGWHLRIWSRYVWSAWSFNLFPWVSSYCKLSMSSSNPI